MATKHQPTRTIGGRTNDERAEAGGSALYGYARQVFHHPSGEEIPTALQDMLCDILHFMAAVGMEDPSSELLAVLPCAISSYECETFGGEPHMDDEHSEEPPFAEEPWCAPEDWMIYYRRRLGEDEDE